MNRSQQSSKDYRTGAWLVLTAAFLWGATETAHALAPESASPASIGMIRLVLGGITLLGFAIWRNAFQGKERWPYKTTLAAISIAAYQICFFAGVARTGVAIGTMVGIGSSPILAGIIGYMSTFRTSFNC